MMVCIVASLRVFHKALKEKKISFSYWKVIAPSAIFVSCPTPRKVKSGSGSLKQPRFRWFLSSHAASGTGSLDLNTFCSIHVVAFSVCSVILSVGGRSRLKVLGVLCEFHAFGLCPWFVTEFYQSHHHGQPQTSDKYIENACHIAQAQSAGLVLTPGVLGSTLPLIVPPFVFQLV